MPPGELVRVERLSKSFGRRPVLRDVSFSAARGSIVAVVGGNGAGKTTLLRCLAGLASFRGAVTVDGRALGPDPRSRALIGYVPQRAALPGAATVAEVLRFFARLREVAPGDHPLPDGFLPPLDQPVGSLSGGQLQRLILAVGLLGRPPLLLLDEPVANLDEEARAMAWDTISSCRSGGAAVLVATPSPSDLGTLHDRELVLDDGVLRPAVAA